MFSVKIMGENTEEKCVEEQFRGRMMALTIALSAVIVPFIALLGGYLILIMRR